MSEQTFLMQSQELNSNQHPELDEDFSPEKYQVREVGSAALAKLYERIVSSPHLKLFPPMET